MKRIAVRIALIVLLIILIACVYVFWWYGFLPEIGKVKNEPYDIASINYPQSTEISSEDYLSDFKKSVSQMTTMALVDTFIAITRWDNPGPYHYVEDSISGISEFNPDNLSTPYAVLLAELFQRKNAGRLLLQAYKDLPTTDAGEYKGFSNKSAIGNLELLLSSEKIQRHLTPWEKNSLNEVADQKQKEKFSDYNYPFSDARFNYLYEDTYGENALGYIDWIEDKVEARSRQFEQYRKPVVSAALYVNSIAILFSNHE